MATHDLRRPDQPGPRRVYQFSKELRFGPVVPTWSAVERCDAAPLSSDGWAVRKAPHAYRVDGGPFPVSVRITMPEPTFVSAPC